MSENGAKAKIKKTAIDLTVPGVGPTPAETWEMMIRFSGPNSQELAAMRQTVDVIFQHGYELVVGTYEHLQRTPETAEILGWEHGFDEKHLAERRRFFTIWLARTISMDFGTDFANYLFHAGQVHGTHGPRQVHTPSMWVTGSIGLVLSKFSDFIRTEHNDVNIVAPALAGWNKYLLLQLNQMNTGYDTAVELDRGQHTVEIKAYAMVRVDWGRETINTSYYPGQTVADVLRKVLNYSSGLRNVMFDKNWEAKDREQDLWMTVSPVYTLRPGWRVQHNGKNLQFHGGFQTVLESRDTLELVSPGR